MRAARETCTWTIVRPGGKKVENHWFRGMDSADRIADRSGRLYDMIDMALASLQANAYMPVLNMITHSSSKVIVSQFDITQFTQNLSISF